MRKKFANQKVRQYRMKAEIEFTVDIIESLAKKLELSGELRDVLETIVMPTADLMEPQDVESGIVQEHLTQSDVTWRIDDFQGHFAEVEDIENFETLVIDKDDVGTYVAEDVGKAIAGVEIDVLNKK